jgi:hypothetical protein
MIWLYSWESTFCQSCHKTLCFQSMKLLQTKKSTCGGYKETFHFSYKKIAKKQNSLKSL